MSESMVERVARAICDRNPDAMARLPYNEVVRPGFAGGPTRLLRETEEMPAWKLFEAKARAAIEAMAAGECICPTCGLRHGISSRDDPGF